MINLLLYSMVFDVVGSRFICKDNIECPGVRSLQDYNKPNIYD